MDILRFEQYSVYFKVKKDYCIALDQVDLSIEKGEFVAVTGPSGCGKTTLLRSAMGLTNTLTSGDVFLHGRPVGEVDISQENIGYLSQEYSLYPSMTIYENIAYPLTVMGVDRDETDRRVKEMADILGLTPLLTRKPRQLSGGQQQRVALGRLLIKNPKLALFDEPFSNVSPDTRRELGQLVRTLHERLGNTVLFVTHDVEEARTLADRVITMEQGEIQSVETMEHPAARPTAGGDAPEPLPLRHRPRRRWKWAAVATALLAVVIGGGAVRAMRAVPEAEQVKVACVGTQPDESALKDGLLSALSDQGLRAVHLDAINYANAETRYTAIWAASQEADLVVFAQNALPEGLAENYFPPLAGEWPEGDVYTEDGAARGVCLGERFAGYCSGEDGYILFFTDAGQEKELTQAAAKWLTGEG